MTPRYYFQFRFITLTLGLINKLINCGLRLEYSRDLHRYKGTGALEAMSFEIKSYLKLSLKDELSSLSVRKSLMQKTEINGVRSTEVRRSLGKGWYVDTSIQKPGNTK